MVDWNSQAEILHDADVFSKFMHALLGLYAWEWANSLLFDISVLTGTRKFKWPMTFYFLNRYCLLAALIGIIVSFNVQSEIDCQSLYMFNQIMGNFSIGLSSINLSIRTIAVWKSHWFVIVPLVAMILGHWVLLLRTVVLVKAIWVEEARTCQVIGNDPKLITAVYIYSMIFDFIVMCLTGFKLGFGLRQKSELVKMLYLDGIMYFFIAFTANLIAVIFSVLNLNPIMSIIADVPATTIATIAACRVVRRLNTFVNSQGVDIYTPNSARPGQMTSGGYSGGTVQFSNGARPETRIQMDVISKTHYDDLERGDSPGEIKASAY